MKKKLMILGTTMALMMFFSYGFIRPVRAAVDRTYDQLKLLVEVMGIIQENYVEIKDNKELLTGAIHGMVHTLDPFSQFMEQHAYTEMKTETEGEFGGLGIRIAMKNEFLTVITPILRTPAYRTGILPEDRIVKVNDKFIRGMPMDDVVALLRGAPGTKVTVTILREGLKDTVDFPLIRQIIKIETIHSKMLDKEIGYIQLTEFSATSQKDLAKALGELSGQGMKSLILDLRNNPGGLLDIAVAVCREFVNDGKLVVFTQGRLPESRHDYMTKGKAPYGDLPFVVLVNRGSASASEIVAGAMQDLKRALIIGATTYGKGSVQSIFPFDDGSALRLTTAKYYTPSGRSIHRDEKTGKGGVIPDTIVEVPREIEAKLYAQSEFLFADGKEPQAIVKKEDQVVDTALVKAIEHLKKKPVK
ncbi:MAG: S41 family peptidase [Elusimicrobia bacterium]|nr:S41 family peptidase [Elusimicrobiota bacterium]